MDYKKIGLFLAQERKAKKLTQAQVADMSVKRQFQNGKMGEACLIRVY